jgi:Septum formation
MSVSRAPGVGVRLRHTRRRGWLVVGAAGIVALAGCGGKTDVSKPKQQAVLDIGTGSEGTCLQVDDKLGAEVTKLPVIACDQPHTHEIYAIVKYTEKDVYPGTVELETFAQRECLGAFEPYVGISAFDSTLFFTWMVPSLEGWNTKKDRDVLCVLGAKDGRQITKSMKGTNL